MTSNRKIQLRFDVIPADDDGYPPFVLIEGNKAGLERLAEMILEQAHDPDDCGTQRLPGQRPIPLKAKMGFYIHRLPCMNK